MAQPIATPVGTRSVFPSDFAPLLRQVRQRGLLRPRTLYYTTSILLNLLFLAACWFAVVAAGGSWWVVALAVPLSVFTARTAFLGHDAGHQQIARSRRVNRALGLLHGNLLTGMSFGWWTSKHNRHHANPNDVGKDPDVGAGALVWTRAQADSRSRWVSWLTPHQAVLFFPLLLLEGVNLKIASIRDLRNRPQREQFAEAVLLVAHVAWYLTVVLAVMPPAQAVLFVGAHHALLGLHLGCAFAPNHKGMPMPTAGQRWDHLRKQVLTSRNVRGGPLVDWLLGGLNYQIEHHLFPSMPRPCLRQAQPLVRAHCERVGLGYVETGALDAYAGALRHLRAVGS